MKTTRTPGTTAAADVRSRILAAYQALSRNAGSALIVALSLSLAAPISGAQTLPYSETFTDTEFLDAAATTAEGWDNAPGPLQLPNGTPLVAPFSDTTPTVLIGPATDTRAVALADMDGDGDLDLIDGARGPNGVQLNNGTGSFGSRTITPFPPFTNTRSLAVGDVNRDGFNDFVAANFAAPSNIYINDGTTGKSFLIQEVTVGNTLASGVALADIDGDGFLDIILATDDFNDNLLLLNTRDPVTPFGLNGSAGIPLGTLGEESRHVVAGDLDNDGDMDIVFVNRQNPNPGDGDQPQLNRVLMNGLAQGSPLTFTESVIGTRPADVDDSRHAALGDLNGDGFLDLVVANRTDGDASKVYFNDGSGVANSNPFTLPALEFTIAGPPSTPVLANDVTLADADNDGDLDIFLINASPDFRNSIYFNDGLGNFGPAVFVGTSTQDGLVLTEGAESLGSAVGDVNGDGALDWVVGNQVNNPVGPQENMLFLNEGTPDVGSALQLSAHATSLPVDTSGTVTSVRLNPLPTTTAVGAQFHNDIEYWVTGTNNPTNVWTRVSPDGRPVAVVGTSGLRWRAVLKSSSPDSAASLALQQLDIAVNASGPGLVSAYPDTGAIQGDSATGLPIDGSFTDSDGDTVYYSVLGLPAGTGLAIDPLTGSISGTPTLADATASPMTVTVVATDGGLASTDEFALTVVNVHFTSTPVTDATQDAEYVYNVTAADPDADPMTISAPTAPAWLTLLDNGDGTATLSGTPTNAEVGDHTVSLQVTDGTFTDIQDFTVTVANVNDAPTFTSTPLTTATEGVAYSYTVTTEDIDGDLVAITGTVVPSWLTLTDNGDGTATLAGTPAGADVGSHPVDLQASDGNTGTASQQFTVTVTASGEGPVITLLGAATVTITVGDSYTDAGATATDPQDGDLTAQIVVNNPVDTNTAGTYTVTYTVTDGAGNSAQAQRTVIVQAAPVDEPPTITLNGDAVVTITEGNSYTDAGATAMDAEDGDLTDQITVNNPVDTSTPGSYTVTYTVQDSAGNEAQAQRTVTVVAAPPPPPPPPPPPSGGGGGGSFGLAELLTFLMAGLAIRGRRRRY